jgi:hypothetical protein
MMLVGMEDDPYRVSQLCPPSLSLSKACLFPLCKEEGQGFDKLSLSGVS